ncbi:type VI secretion system-associated protein TagF [Caulobacter segnis]
MPRQTVSAPHVFAFGKLPTHGDFVSRGLTANEREAWDRWASASLEAARAALGDAFENGHDTAPPVRFAFGSSAFGSGWSTGALTASIDAAGRRFIIVLGVRTDTARSARERIAEAAEDEIHRAFEAGSDIDAMVAKAQDVFQTLESEGDPDAYGRFWRPVSPFDISAGQPPADLITRALTI